MSLYAPLVGRDEGAALAATVVQLACGGCRLRRPALHSLVAEPLWFVLARRAVDGKRLGARRRIVAALRVAAERFVGAVANEPVPRQVGLVVRNKAASLHAARVLLRWVVCRQMDPQVQAMGGGVAASLHRAAVVRAHAVLPCHMPLHVALAVCRVAAPLNAAAQHDMLPCLGGGGGRAGSFADTPSTARGLVDKQELRRMPRALHQRVLACAFVLQW